MLSVGCGDIMTSQKWYLLLDLSVKHPQRGEKSARVPKTYHEELILFCLVLGALENLIYVKALIC